MYSVLVGIYQECKHQYDALFVINDLLFSILLKQNLNNFHPVHNTRFNTNKLICQLNIHHVHLT
jgi:hypothetical protein